MNGKTHLLTGIAAGVLLSRYDPETKVAIITAASIGSLLPDIDHPRALISSFIPGGFIFSWIMGGHRGITHTILAGFVAGGLAYLITDHWYIALALAVGWFTHLLGDMLTPSGVPLLLPFQWRMRLLPRSLLQVIAPLIEAGVALTAFIIAALILLETLGLLSIASRR